MNDQTISFDRDRWWQALEDIAHALGKDGEPVEICLIGSAVCIFSGMDQRTSIDLDIWTPNSDFDEIELKNAVLSAGLLFDPKSFNEPNKPYIQIVEPGIVQTGKFTSVLLKKMGRLRITRPPYENLIASKLTRANLKDIQDIQYMMQNFLPDKKIIREIIHTLPDSMQEIALDNFIYLDILQ